MFVRVWNELLSKYSQQTELTMRQSITMFAFKTIQYKFENYTTMRLKQSHQLPFVIIIIFEREITCSGNCYVVCTFTILAVFNFIETIVLSWLVYVC